MCGIFGYIGFRKNVARLVFEGLKSLEYRGYDSWGVAAVSDGKIFIKKKAGRIGDFNVNDLPSGNIAIGHTRWATHGSVTDVNAHPHLDCKGKIAVIHNGIFENYEKYRKSLIKKGHKFISQTDTEVISHLLERYDFKTVFNKMEGLNAVIAINSEREEIFAVRNGSPLVIGFGKGENFLASDAAALIPYTRKVHFLEDDESVVITADKVIGITSKIQTLHWRIEEGQKGRFKHFMLKSSRLRNRVIRGSCRGIFVLKNCRGACKSRNWKRVWLSYRFFEQEKSCYCYIPIRRNDGYS